MNPLDFFQKYGDSIIEACQGTGLFPSVKAAQAALETGFGKSMIGDGKNMFGIKATGKHTPYWDGSQTVANTPEVIGGVEGRYNLAFRKYNSVADSIRDHSYLLTTLPIYKNVLSAKTPEEQATLIQKSGYATAPNYAEVLIKLIHQYNLKSLDAKKKS